MLWLLRTKVEVLPAFEKVGAGGKQIAEMGQGGWRQPEIQEIKIKNMFFHCRMFGTLNQILAYLPLVRTLYLQATTAG